MEREKLIALVTGAQQGNPDAMNALFNAFYNDVYYFALKTVKDEDLACDITQETFVEIINTLGELQEPAAFVKWMKQITYHQCTRYFKKKKDVIVDEDEDGNTVFDTLQEEKTEFIPDAALDQAELKRTLMAMIDGLSEEQRAAVMLFYFDELTIRQIAEIQGTNENTVKSRLNYAKKSIKKSVEDYEKKTGVKLRCAGILPLLLWLFRAYFGQKKPASAAAVAKGVSAATGTTVTVAATAAAVAGAGVKTAAVSVTTKIIAGVVAASLVVGGAVAAITLSRDDKPGKKTSTSSKHKKESKDDDTDVSTDTSDGTTASDATETTGGNSETVPPAEVKYYDPSRISVSELTMEDIIPAMIENAKNASGETGGNPNRATYDRVYAASCYGDMDIFGYNLTAEDISGRGWGIITLYADLLGEEKEPSFTGAQANLRLPFETKETVVAAAQRDLLRFMEFLGGQGRSKLTVCGKNYIPIPGATMDQVIAGISDAEYEAVADGESIYVTTQDPVVLDGVSYKFTVKIFGSKRDGFYYYNLVFTIGVISD